jgi:hypothetical protein
MNITTAYDTIMGFGADKIMGFLGQFFAECLETLSIVSYDFLVVAGLIGLIMYVFGWEKGKNWGLMCPAIYIIIQILSKVICHA